VTKHIHFRRYRDLFGLLHAFVALQEREYAAEDVGPLIPQLFDGLTASVRPYYFYFEDERERAVARLTARSEQLEPPAPAAAQQ
jgi:hypothetical protein